MPEQQREPHTGDGAGELHDAVEIVGGHLVAAQRIGGNADPGEADIRLDDERLQHFRQQPHAPFRRAGVHRGVDLFRIDAVLEQRGGDAQRAGGRVGEAKAAGVGEQSDIQRLRALGCERPARDAREIEDQLRRRGRIRSDQARTDRQVHRPDVMVDAHERGLPPLDHRRELAEPREVADVERRDDVRALDLAYRMLARVRTCGKEEGEPVRNAGGIGDLHRDALRPQHVPESDFAADAVAVRIDVRRENDVTRARQGGRNVTCRPSALGWNRYSVRTHLGQDNRVLNVVCRQGPLI